MRTWKSLLSGVAALMAWITMPGLARAQIPIPGLPQIVYDPANVAKSAITALQTARMVEQQIRQFEQQFRRLRNPTWRDIDGYVRGMEALLRQGEALGYSVSELDRQFRETFPGYRAAASNLAIPEAQRLQARRTLATMGAALDVLNAHAQQFQVGRAKLDRIKAQMSGIQGTQEALELQTTLDAYLAEEVGLLRQTVATQANLEAVYNAYEVNQQEQIRANYRAMMDRMSTLPPPSSRNFSLQVRR
jgi:P-type conjugative transfer protein TrbJ